MAEAESKQNQNGKINHLMPKCLQTDDLKVNLSPDLELDLPDVHDLFAKFNKLYFDGDICFCELKWIDSDELQKQKQKEKQQQQPKGNNKNNQKPKPPPKRKKYAGQCVMDPAGLCCICLEQALLQFKSTKYVMETLIHQMIHSYLLKKKMDVPIGHSDTFKSIMNSINTVSAPYIKLTLNNKQCRKNDDYPSEIIPDQLYLGNIHHALNLEILKDIKITHVINCTQSIDCKFGDQGIKYIRVPVNDKVSVSILPFFVKAIRFIESVREENGGKNDNRILIHCHAGISRSTTITIAYLMYSWKLTMFDAITHVQSNRYIIQPNQGFKNQLLDFYLYLEANEGNLDDFEKNHKAQSQSAPKQQNAIAKPKAPLKLNKNNDGDGSSDNDDDNNNNNNKEYVACPVCDKFFSPKYINKHLDESHF